MILFQNKIVNVINNIYVKFNDENSEYNLLKHSFILDVPYF